MRNDLDRAMSINYLEITLANQQQYKDALQSFQKFLSIRQKFSSENHPDIGISYANRGGVYSDFNMVMISLIDDTNKMKYFDGHQAPILGLNIYEEKQWIATSCCNGSVRIFNIDKQTLV
ncbi:unnamed protein product, partial [Rotaria sp. Silwood2]